MISPTVLSELKQIVGPAGVSISEVDRQQHGRDQSSHPLSPPDAVVWPENTAQVSAIARLAHEGRIPLVGWGAGTSIEGNPIPNQGGIVIDFCRRMNRILTIHEQDFQVTVQPGVLYKDMNRELARSALFFAPDPGANASIGGMIANNAAGSRTVKYGATRDNVLALEVVLAGGEIIRTGSRSVKQSAGYDLTHLFTGSEGTLGLITEATIKLAPLPEHFSVATAAFETVQEAAEAVFGIMGSGLNPAALELLDENSARIMRDAEGFDLALSTNLFMEFTGASSASLREELRLVEEICLESGCTRFESGTGHEARSRLWEARHRLFETMVRSFPGHDWLVTDVAVPISSYPELAGFTADKMTALELRGGLIGHAGDGNLHACIFYPAGDQAALARTAELNEQMVDRALALGGTSTGEHGVGLGKQKYMVREHGEAAVALMHRLKTVLDPHNILNPGKVLGRQ